MKMPKFNFYATLLDVFSNYLNSYEIWEKYWGWSDNPPYNPQEFLQKQFDILIATINRVDKEISEAAIRGTCFNEIVDCLIHNKNTDNEDIKIETMHEMSCIKATINNSTFMFPINICQTFANYFKGAISQFKCDGTISTIYGEVNLSGYVDELMPFGVHDIKTTKSYRIGKFKENWQHRIYPYCLTQMGVKVDYFEYNVLEYNGYKYEIFKEYYNYNHEKSTKEIKDICEQFIEFLLDNRELIKNNKIIYEYE